MIREELLFSSTQGSPLVILIPGGTGTRKKTMSGFNATASHFWLNGYSAYIAETAGQDGHEGVFSLKRCLSEIGGCLQELQSRLQPRKLAIFGSCSGGTVGTHIAANGACDALIMWETLPEYDNASRSWFVERAKSEVALAPEFMDEYIETRDRANEVHCPILSCYGIGPPSPVFTENDAREIRSIFSNTSRFSEVAIPGADHSLTRGTDPALLRHLLSEVEANIKIMFSHPRNNTQSARKATI